MVTQNPNLISKQAMQATSSTDGSGVVLMSEVLTKVITQKTNQKRFKYYEITTINLYDKY